MGNSSCRSKKPSVLQHGTANRSPETCCQSDIAKASNPLSPTGKLVQFPSGTVSEVASVSNFEKTILSDHSRNLDDSSFPSKELFLPDRTGSKNFGVENDEIYGDPDGETPIKLPKVVFANNVSYTGEWLRKKKHGVGRQEWSDNAVYEGEWVDGCICGEGVFTHSNGDTYKGQWKNDAADGYGVYKFSDGTEYAGQWKMNKKHGYGKEIYSDGRYYEGQYVLGSEHGKGTYYFTKGAKYTGEFKQGRYDGFGIYNYENGEIYKGYWKDNLMHGEGILELKDGRKYVGNYSRGFRDGQGMFVWPDSKIYKGGWKNNKQHGVGYVKFRNGEIKRGLYQEGRRIRWLEPDEYSDVVIREDYDSILSMENPIGNEYIDKKDGLVNENGDIVEEKVDEMNKTVVKEKIESDEDLSGQIDGNREN